MLKRQTIAFMSLSTECAAYIQSNERYKWAFFFLKRWQIKCALLRIRICKSLPNVYVNADSMGGRSVLAWFSRAIATDICATNWTHIVRPLHVCFYSTFLRTGRLLTQSPKVFGVSGSQGSWSQAFGVRCWLMYTIRIVCIDTLNWLQWLPFQFWELIRVSAVSKFKESAGETICRWK